MTRVRGGRDGSARQHHRVELPERAAISSGQARLSRALTEDDLARVVGGSGDPIELDPDLKATPILFLA